MAKRFVLKKDVVCVGEEVMLTLVQSFGKSFIVFFRNEVEETDHQFIFDKEEIEKRAAEAWAKNMRKGNPQFVAGVRNVNVK